MSISAASATASAMDDVADLVLTPFRDIVDKGKTAIVNAGEAQPMIKASLGLVKEGERALKRIEPLCKKNLDEYGPSFLAALKENDEIAHYRSELNELLWEFDDYIELDEFDQDKFSQVQVLSRKAAPKIYDIIMRMKLEVQGSPRDNIHNFMRQLSPPSSPPPIIQSPAVQVQSPTPPSGAALASLPLSPPPKGPLPPIPGSAAHAPQPRSHRNSVASSAYSDPRSPADVNNVAVATRELRNLTMHRGSHSSTVDNTSSDFGRDAESASGMEPPPRPPSANPWDVRVQSPPDDRAESSFERRDPAPVGPEDSPVLPSSLVRAFESERRNSNPVPRSASGRSSAPSDSGSQDGEERRRPLNGNPGPPGPPGAPGPLYTPFPRPRNPILTSNVAHTIPEENALGDISPRDDVPPVVSPMTTFTPHSLQTSQSMSDYRSSYATSDSSSSTRMQRQNGSEFMEPHPGLEVTPRNIVVNDIDQGLIPVESERLITGPVQTAVKDLTIRGTSSFHIHKGFCEGSKEVLRGGIGGFTTTTTIARCTSCLYELDFKDIENDLNQQGDATYTKSGIQFRLRFLQKSHLPIKRMDDMMYGCLFCIQLGQTTDESDATVFFSTKSLLSHLSRHPRPLPEVPGLSVIDSEEVPDDRANNFDLHFLAPPKPNPAAENATFVSQLPTATAREQARRLYGQRLLHDRSAALELSQGARITGIEFPERYNGEWIQGWHDGVHATAPVDILKLDPPPMGHIRMSTASLIRGKSRWKFAAKDKNGDWLKFDKGELITNINWPCPEHWCWSGTNAKGKWGIFPQVFIEPNTVRELSVEATGKAGELKLERDKPSGFLSRLASRKTSGRPPSVAGSTSSHETPYIR